MKAGHQVFTLYLNVCNYLPFTSYLNLLLQSPNQAVKKGSIFKGKQLQMVWHTQKQMPLAGEAEPDAEGDIQVGGDLEDDEVSQS